MCHSFVCSLSGNPTLLVLLGVSVVSELYRELRWDEREGLNKVEVGLGNGMGLVVLGGLEYGWTSGCCDGVVVLVGLVWGTGWDWLCWEG